MKMQTQVLALLCVGSTIACSADRRTSTEPSSSDSTTITSSELGTKRIGSNSQNGSTAQSPSDSIGPSAPGWVEPAATTPITDVDNTKVNERDRGPSVTPLDQGNSAAETNITAAIRRGVVADKSLSFMSKNVKIVTNGTSVTLRGPVSNEYERTTIVSLARQAAGVTFVDDQLQVKH